MSDHWVHWHAECPRCGERDAYVEPDLDRPHYADIECTCWPERFSVRYDPEYDRYLILGAAGDEGRAREAEAHPDERVVGWGQDAA
jgi:hypothetical protein